MDFELPLSTLTPLGALCFVLVALFLAFSRGKLHTQSTIDRMVADHVREMADVKHDRDEWRAESRLKDAQIAEKDKQLGHLKEVGRTVNSVMRALQQQASQERGPT